MRFVTLTPILAVLALAACGDDQQTAQAPSENSSVTSSNSGSAAPPVSTGQNTVATTTAPSTAAPAMDPDAATATAAPPASSTAAAPPATTPAPAEDSTGAVTATAAIEPGTYESDRFNLRLENGGTFTMREKTGNGDITGRYALSGNVLTFQDAKGDTGSTTFPIRCRIEPEGSGFRLADQDGACAGLKDATFKRGS